MIADFKERCEEVYKYWNKHMPMMAAEECAELIKAISKFERHSCPETTKDLVDEIGDLIGGMTMKLKFGELIEILSNYYIFCDAGFRIRIKNDKGLGDVTFSPRNLGLMDYYSDVQVRKFDIDESKHSEVIVYLEGEADDQTETVSAESIGADA